MISLGRKKKSIPPAEMTLLDHLAELRTRLVRSAMAIFVGAVVVWIFHKRLLTFLSSPYCEYNESIGRDCEELFLITRPLESFSTVLAVVGYGGVLLALPVVLYQLARFVLPGLYPQERRMLYPMVAMSVILMGIGMFGGFTLMPKTLSVLFGFGLPSFNVMLSPAEYISFFVKMLFAFGVAAQFPLVLVFLQMIGLVPPETLRSNRRLAAVGVLILAAVITPTGDPFTLFFLAAPMYLSYEVAILVGMMFARRRAAKN